MDEKIAYLAIVIGAILLFWNSFIKDNLVLALVLLILITLFIGGKK